MYRSFKEKGATVFGYDKYKKDIDMGPLDLCLNTKISFLCLNFLIKKQSHMTKLLHNVCLFK